MLQLVKYEGWLYSGYLDRCDRCSERGASPIYLGNPPDVLLLLCPDCEQHVKFVMLEEDSGYLGKCWAMAKLWLMLPEGSQARAAPERSDGEA